MKISNFSSYFNGDFLLMLCYPNVLMIKKEAWMNAKGWVVFAVSTFIT